jgi:alpha-1,3-rhamnosyl/mannosyltransferase
VPVVTSNVSSLPEVAGDAALLVDPYDVDSIADALNQLLENPARRDTLIERGLARSRAFTWEQAARQLLHHYHELVA